jgi:hypothetical protein
MQYKRARRRDREAMDWDACPRVSEGIEINKVADGYIIYHPERDRVHYLNHTAVLLLELCDGRTRAGDLAGLLKAAYDLSAPPTGEVSDCLVKLFEEGLLR